jgi:hypothetical protein
MNFKLTIIILAVFRCEFVPSNQQKSSKIRLSSEQQKAYFSSLVVASASRKRKIDQVVPNNALNEPNKRQSKFDY